THRTYAMVVLLRFFDLPNKKSTDQTTPEAPAYAEDDQNDSVAVFGNAMRSIAGTVVVRSTSVSNSARVGNRQPCVPASARSLQNFVAPSHAHTSPSGSKPPASSGPASSKHAGASRPSATNRQHALKAFGVRGSPDIKTFPARRCPAGPPPSARSRSARRS